MTNNAAGPDPGTLARYARYNASPKGRARRQRYEERHPERGQRWDVVMRIRAQSLPAFAPPPDPEVSDDAPARFL